MTRRAWHGWCVVYVVVALPGTHHCCVHSGHVYDVGVPAWSGGCGSRSAAKSCGAQRSFAVAACRGGFVRALLLRCMSWNDYAFDSRVVFDNHGDVCEVACVEELCVLRGDTRPSLSGA